MNKPEAPIVLKIEGLFKTFKVSYHNSLKERLVNFGRFKRHSSNFTALQNINLELKMGESLGLVGHNGSGKSTLLKLIGGILEPSEGKILRRGRVAALLELGTGFHPDLTGRENIFLNAALLGVSKEEIDEKIEAIIDFAGIREFINTQVKFYSSGMYVRLAFSVAVHSDPDILLVDEVLAVGDEPFQEKCLQKIDEFKSEGRTIILVSHAAKQVVDTCNRVIVLDHGVIKFDGDPKRGIRKLRELYRVEN